MSLIIVRNLDKYFRDHKTKKDKQILFDINFEIESNVHIGLIGESGCGKTTLAKSLLNLQQKYFHPNDHGQIIYRGQEIQFLKESKFRPYRKKLQIIYQDPFTSLNHKMTVWKLLEESIKKADPKLSQDKITERIHELAELYHIQKSNLQKKSRELSGGECRRVGIARVMAVRPDFLIADEPVASLDASIKDQIMLLLVKHVPTMMVISHDMRIISKYTQKIIILYGGSIMEIAYRNGVNIDKVVPYCFYHPYSKILKDSIDYFALQKAPIPPFHKFYIKAKEQKLGCTGFSKGCIFLEKCPLLVNLSLDEQELCKSNRPPLTELAGSNNKVACHFPPHE